MKKAVRLEGIIEGMEMHFDEANTFLNVKEGVVVQVDDNDFRIAEEDEPFNHLPDWQQENIKIAIDIMENFEDYIKLPTKFDIHEYEMMEDFCYSLSSDRNKDRLLNTISGRGGFRRFKDEIIRLGIQDDWYEFRDECYKQIVIKWCNDYGIKYII
ncbi:MAG TPA: hypothetical protein GX497_13865 [Bacillus bacterium]|nr:hypothetical protein [Bacillus sp. (in: firmicutes)]